jgi:hypothetical protein
MENSMTKFRTAGLALAGLLAVTAASTTGAEAQWRRHHHWGWGGPGIAAGIATGALVGAAVASRPYYGGYYGGGYGYYEEPVYAAPYAYDAPYAYAPVYPSWGSSNFCMEGYRRVACSQGGGY